MKKIALLLLLGCTVSAMAATKYYIADDETNFANPERGFYTASEQDITQTTTESNLNDGAFNQNSGRSLVYRQYVFSGFREDSLAQTVLDLVDTDMATYRKNGFKCVLRFSYTVSEEQVEGKYQDGSPEIWEMHLKQLKPVMAKNADVIAMVQAGFLGVWGEWYYSSTGTGDAIPQTVRTNLISQMLEAVPECRTVQLRTPKYKTNYLGDSNPLSEEEAFSGSARARLGHFNDAFLYGEKNMGTYTNRKKDMNYLDQECLYLPNGGESDVTTQDIYDKWATGKQAKEDMAKVHFSYMNQDYSQLVISNWRKEGAFNEIAMHMGYRFQLIEATAPALVRPNANLAFTMNIRNVGYASLYNERKAYIVLHNADNTYLLPLQSDPRLWAPNGAIAVVDESLALPAGIIEGTYDIALYLPDVFESIAADPRYAVRLANFNVWDETSGYNELGLQVLVSATEPEPEPEPEPTPTASVEPISHFSGRSYTNNVRLHWVNPTATAHMDTLVVDLSQGRDTAYNDALGNSSASVSYASGVSSVNYETKAVWLWAGVRFPVDSLDEVQTISFEYKGDGKSISLISYAHDGTYRWIEDEGASVQLNSTAWQKYSFTPMDALWSDGPTHKFGDEPITDLGFIANPASSTKGAFQIRNVFVINEIPPIDNFAAVRIVCKMDAKPTGLNDGQTVYFGRGDEFVDAGLAGGHTYHYAAYTYGKDGKVSLPKYFSVWVGTTDIEQVNEDLRPATKMMINGKLMIIHNGVQYNALGQRIK